MLPLSQAAGFTFQNNFFHYCINLSAAESAAFWHVAAKCCNNFRNDNGARAAIADSRAI